MAASITVAGTCSHCSRLLALQSSPATRPPCWLLLHNLQNQAAASFRVLIQQGGGQECGEAGGREGRREEGPNACWHPKEEHVCSWPAA